MHQIPPDSWTTRILSQAHAVREVRSDDDASSMLEDGWILVHAAPTKDPERPFCYALIWPKPRAETPSIILQRYHL